MAEVLSPPLQPSSTISMLHSRPASADAFQPQRPTQAPRSMYNGHNYGSRAPSNPVQPYAFHSTPNLTQTNRTNSTPGSSSGDAFSNHRATQSASTTSSDSSGPPTASEENSSASRPRPESLINISQSIPDLSLTSFDVPAKTVPDRYRRPTGKRVESSSSSSNETAAQASSPALAEPQRLVDDEIVSHTPFLQRQTSLDDVAMQRERMSQSELAKRYKRRSLIQLETRGFAAATVSQATPGAQQGSAIASGSATTNKSAPVTASERQQASSFRELDTKDGAQKSETTVPSSSPSTQQAAPRYTVPPRASSEAVKRLAAPSPLSQHTSDMNSPPSSPGVSPSKARASPATAMGTAPALSPAAQQLAAVSDRDLNKGMKSRLRRAFSFGSAQELRRVGIENNQQVAQQTREQHQQQIDDELDSEQLEIARRQEAAGIGAGIYSGQGGFTGSTDNLSISSTASSASIMLRKMGRGAKKGARSIKGLFRPKSVIGVPAADGPVQAGVRGTVEPSVGQVSMVTVEAERHIVNVNAHPDENIGGETNFPKLERNSLEASIAGVTPEAPRGSNEGSDAQLRRSIVGNEKDRAEVLAAVRKGILKRSNTASPTGSPVVRASEGGIVPSVPQLTESPSSSMPSTPKEATQGRSSSAPVVNGDYFNTRLGVAKSVPNTPNGSVRSISFSPRIQFHDAWSATDYDRRGEIATCNRLTPLLAQQIKEELNTFKMEMEVHELSKPHTHFF